MTELDNTIMNLFSSLKDENGYEFIQHGDLGWESECKRFLVNIDQAITNDPRRVVGLIIDHYSKAEQIARNRSNNKIFIDIDED